MGESSPQKKGSEEKIEVELRLQDGNEREYPGASVGLESRGGGCLGEG